jgi:hypothetical protein
MAQSQERTAKAATAEAFDEGRWFSTFCHAPKGSHWFCRGGRRIGRGAR